MTYTDPYLAPICDASPGREAQAILDVDALGDFSDYWRNRLIVLRMYIIICSESTQSRDDAFAIRLDNYRKEFNTVVTQALAAASTDATTNRFFTIPLERA
jgi:hypothetical protein